MLKWASISEDAKKAAITLIIEELQPKLLQCDDIHKRLIGAGEKAFAEANVEIASGKDTLPHLIGLKEEAEAFLNTSKQYLRDLTLLVNALLGSTLPREAKVFWELGKLSEPAAAVWGREKLGDEFGDWLADQAKWIGELCKKRNAVEHPGGQSGTISFHNFQRYQDNTFLPTSWLRVGPKIEANQTDLLGDLGVYIQSLLAFSEELVAYAVKLNPTFPHIEIVEIDEAARKPEAPMRLKIGLKAEYWPPVTKFAWDRLRRQRTGSG
ncbi:MAG: hypothetical protein JWQ22_2102 [Devosia sp.]|nr:hypothetical protein [Devosia sp.]